MTFVLRKVSRRVKVRAMSYADHPHKNGRPRRGASQTETLSIRLTQEELTALNARATERETPRVVLIREAMRRFGLFAEAG